MNIHHRHLYLSLKRAFDVLTAGLMLLLFAPLFAAVCIAVRTKLGGPVFFRQERIGLDEKSFHLLKFRTMLNSRTADGRLLPDSERLTRTGLFLREWSLDELPQLWNVLRGEMSLVGPRPLLPRYMSRYTMRQRQRHIVKPGITGWAQVNGRNSVNWADKFEMDVWYAEHCSILLDFRILLTTAKRVLFRTDVHPSGGAQLDEFWGSAERPAGGPGAYPAEGIDK